MSAATGATATVTPIPAGTAEDAAESLRLLNHLTLTAPTAGTPGWEGVGDLYRVIGELRAITDRLPQACDQVLSALHRLGERQDWRTDDGTTKRPDEVIATAVDGLDAAGCAAEDLSWHLQQAHGAVAHLYQ